MTNNSCPVVTDRPTGCSDDEFTITVCVPLNVRIVSPPPPAFSMKKVGKPPRFHKRAIYGEMGAVVKA